MDDLPQRPPATLDALLRRTRALGFDAACEARTGSLLRVLAASKTLAAQAQTRAVTLEWASGIAVPVRTV